MGGSTGAATGTTSADAAAAPLPVRGSPETVANLSAQIIRNLDAQTTRFDVALDPAGLGHVDVRVEIGADGRVSAAMSFDNPQAAAQLKTQAADIQKALTQAGFDLSGGLSFDVAGDRGGFQRGSQGRSDDGAGEPAFRSRALRTAPDGAGAAVASGGAYPARQGLGAVDVRI